ncbi:MAG: glycosyltransferase family 39 protein, partial [Thermodesulfobacteriota bacterium]|nr:glycosyltransferase family 39 protein [Thermodesulfobacteriota bacterium]
MQRQEKIIFIIALVSCGILVSILGFNRNYFTFATETDFLGAFMPEAKRLLHGESLQLDFHPPLYSFFLAGFNFFLNDWFNTGLFVSLLSCLIVLWANFFLFYHLCGCYSAWAAILGIIVSAPFLTFSCFATSDVFFLALYSCTLLLACLAFERNSKKFWILCGVVCGSVLLTRSNGIT